MSDLDELHKQEYRLRQQTEHLRREVFQQADLAGGDALFEELYAAEQALGDVQTALAEAQASDPQSGLLAKLGRVGKAQVLGADTTGLTAQVHLRMAQVPTSIYHLLDRNIDPLVSCEVQNHAPEVAFGGQRLPGKDTRRLRVTSFIEGYSARAVETFEIKAGKEHKFEQLPTLFPEPLQALNELTRASLNVLVEDLENGKVEIHVTHPVWMLARTSAPLAVRDPKSGELRDLTPYLGAFVTPNAPALMAFLRSAADLHPQKRLVGYQGDKSQVAPQVKALFEALKAQAGIVYVNSVIDFTPEQGAYNQRVRLPRESLLHRQANCVDGAVLFASLLEAISLSPALVVVPGHAFVAWETWSGEPDEWRFLETTMIGSHSFEEACTSGESTAARYRKLQELTKNPLAFRLLPLRQLRTERGITPME